jgi:fibronectin type 3 domain-containing protein
LAGYRIYRSTSSGIYGAPVATVPKNATSFVAAGLKPGVTYFFTVTAVDTAGNESVKSNQVSGSL